MSLDQIFRPSTDEQYHTWRREHPDGWIVNLAGGTAVPVLHRPKCGHIRTHNNAGAFTEHDSEKLCFASYAVLREWHQTAEGTGLKPCKDCKSRVPAPAV